MCENVFCTYNILGALYGITICVCIFSRPQKPQTFSWNHTDIFKDDQIVLIIIFK